MTFDPISGLVLGQYHIRWLLRRRAMCFPLSILVGLCYKHISYLAVVEESTLEA